jgi:hypothetical protein
MTTLSGLIGGESLQSGLPHPHFNTPGPTRPATRGPERVCNYSIRIGHVQVKLRNAGSAYHEF